MNARENPVRLRELLGRGSVLGQGIEAARTNGPTDQELEALERAVLAGIAASATAAVGVAAARASRPASWLSSGTTKLALALIVGASMSVTGTVAWHRGHRAGLDHPSAGATAQPSQLVAPKLAPPSVEATPPASAPERAPVSADQGPAAGSTIVANKLKARTPAQPAKPDDSEITLLERANRALSGSPALALKLVNEHARRFPASTLDQERELIQVTALIGLGRDEDARRLAGRFSQQYPGSAYVGRIDGILHRRAE